MDLKCSNRKIDLYDISGNVVDQCHIDKGKSMYGSTGYYIHGTTVELCWSKQNDFSYEVTMYGETYYIKDLKGVSYI